MYFCVIIRRHPGITLTDTLFPYTTLFRTGRSGQRDGARLYRRYRAQLDVERSACLAEHDGRRRALDRPEQLGIGVDGEVAARIVRIFRREFDIMLVLDRARRLSADELALLDAAIQLPPAVGAPPEGD